MHKVASCELGSFTIDILIKGGVLVNDNQDTLLRLVAKLYYIDNLGQNEIAELVGLSRSQVSRLLSRSRERGVVRISVEQYDPRNRSLENELKDYLKIRRVYVIKVSRDSNPAIIRHTLGYFGAPLVSELFRSNTVVGLAGGRSIYEVINRIEPVGGTMGLTVAQLMGNVGPDVAKDDAIELCRELAQRFMGTFITLSVPVHLDNAQARDVLMQHEHVSRVWRLFDIMDVALVGIGSLQDSMFVDRKMLSAEDIHNLVQHNAVGEICGHFYDPDGQECDTNYRDRVMSIGLNDLRGIDEVIGIVANAESRVFAICAAARSGLIKTLLIDEIGALAILRNAEKNRLQKVV
jgi:DNA-binding transcriptional regulator LsrR (DeoR family)